MCQGYKEKGQARIKIQSNVSRLHKSEGRETAVLYHLGNPQSTVNQNKAYSLRHFFSILIC